MQRREAAGSRCERQYKGNERVESLRGCAPLASIAHLDIILPRVPIRLRDPLAFAAHCLGHSAPTRTATLDAHSCTTPAHCSPHGIPMHRSQVCSRAHNDPSHREGSTYARSSPRHRGMHIAGDLLRTARIEIRRGLLKTMAKRPKGRDVSCIHADGAQSIRCRVACPWRCASLPRLEVVLVAVVVTVELLWLGKRREGVV